MNRSVLLVICDFLILTLLSFVQFDTAPGPTEPNPAERQGASGAAISNVLATFQSALELEQAQRAALTNALAATAAELAERRRLLAEREQSLASAQQKLSLTESEARRLAEERARLERAQAEASASVRELQQAFETTRRGTDSLQEKLSDSTREAAEAKARLRVMEEEMARRLEEAREMQRRLGELDASREVLQEERVKLVGELKKTEAEAVQARREVTNLSRQLATSTEEKGQLIQTAARLATNVGALTAESTAIREEVARQAEQSSAIREQIEKQIRLPANTIYADFLTNRVRVAMSGTTRGGLGQEVVRRGEAGTVLVKQGDRVFAVLHLESTPLRLWPPDAPWSAFSGVLERGGKQVAATEFALLSREPRVAVVPVEAAAVATLGARVYEVTKDPAQFADAVVIGTEATYYGETQFRINTAHAGYLEMEKSTFRRLLGEFSPRRGDLVITKTGELLGLMVNSDRCLVLDQWSLLPAFRCGDRVESASNTAVVRNAQAILDRLPADLK